MKTMRTGRNSAHKKPWSRAAIAVAAAASLSLGACGGDDKPGGGGGDVDVPETADAAVNQFAAAMSSGKMGDAVALLPDSYQKDLNGLVSDFGNSMDPDVWNAVLGLGKDIGSVLTTKKDLIMGSQMFKGMDESGEMAKGYDSVAKTLSDLFGSETITLDSLKKGNMRELLNGAAGGLLENSKLLPDKNAAEAFDKFAKMKAEKISEEGDIAKLRLTTEGEKPIELDFKKVEGRWVPAEMAEDWSEVIAEAKAGIAQLKSPEFAQQKMGITLGIGAVSGIVKQLKDAKSSEQVDQMLGGLMQMMGGGGGGKADGPPPGFDGPPPGLE